MARPHVLLINAGLGGAAGNTAAYLAILQRALARRTTVTEAVLADGLGFAALVPELKRADALVFGTGTHWDGWSSLLQRFLEDATPAEGTTLWLGKPAACVITEHAVGAKAVLSRLQGVLVTLGCLIPPMSGVVLSRAVRTAIESDPSEAGDYWCADDLAVLAHNLVAATRLRPRWRTWPVDRTDFHARWA